jgi:HD-GYP domain-containing protein (c-di-GMP phosphodiesterase class II)
MTREDMLWRSVFNRVNSGIAIYRAIDGGKDFVFIALNKRGEEINHVKEKEVVGKRVTEVFPGVKAIGLFDLFQQVNEKGGMAELPLSHYENSRIGGLWVRNYVFRLPGGEIVAIHDDLTDQIAQQEEIERLTITLVNVLEDITNLNDPVTGHHIKRVCAYSACFAEFYGCDVQFIRNIRRYASLHDIGNVGLSREILNYPGEYSTEQREEVKKHVIYGKQILEQNGFPQIAVNIAFFHHEWWDGTGYVSELVKEETPLEARIVAAADTYDSLTKKRSYKEAYSSRKAAQIMQDKAGTHLDPALVDIFSQNKHTFLAIKKNNYNAVSSTFPKIG